MSREDRADPAISRKTQTEMGRVRESAINNKVEFAHGKKTNTKNVIVHTPPFSQPEVKSPVIKIQDMETVNSFVTRILGWDLERGAKNKSTIVRIKSMMHHCAVVARKYLLDDAAIKGGSCKLCFN